MTALVGLEGGVFIVLFCVESDIILSKSTKVAIRDNGLRGISLEVEDTPILSVDDALPESAVFTAKFGMLKGFRVSDE